ncbi:MAG: DUF3108 domain-containing protein [Zoogloeaceae bacterium]|jgi:hypothetical protein|nr:DUF3108 domain-containing protein [Zoogloeaceae bacterium]
MSFFARFFSFLRFQRKIAVALAISALLHFALLFPMRWTWRFPAPPPQPARLEAALRPLSATPSGPPPMPPRQPMPPAPDPVLLPAASDSPAAPPPETPPPVLERATAAPEDAAQLPALDVQDDPPFTEEAADFFSPRGEVRYVVYRGTQGFEIGRAELSWEIAEGRYRLTSLLRTTGLASLFYPISIFSESVGSIGARGLLPERYQQTRDKDAPEEVTFDYAARRIRIDQNPPVEMNANSHDLLSMQYQFAYSTLSASAAVGVRGTLDFWLATHKKYEHVQFVIVGEEVLELPAGRFDTLHVQAVDKTSADFWLALDYLMLPVRLHFTDKNGNHYEQAAREILIEPDPENEESKTEDEE